MCSSDLFAWPTTTVVFLTLGLAQLALALALRAPRSTRGLGERALEVSVAVAVGLQVLAASWTPLQDLLGTRTVEPAAWAAVLALALLPGVAVKVTTDRHRGRTDQPASSPGSGASPSWK